MKNKQWVKVGLMVVLGMAGTGWKGGYAEELSEIDEVEEVEEVELDIETIISENQKKEDIEGYDVISYEYRKQEEFKRLESLRVEEERVKLLEQEELKPLEEGEGLIYNEQQYGISTFEGGKYKSQEGVYVYQWVDMPTHYLIESSSPVGETIKNVVEGEELVLEGVTYVVHTVKRNVPNDSKALGVLQGLEGDISFQTSEERPEGMSSEQVAPIALWVADRKGSIDNE